MHSRILFFSILTLLFVSSISSADQYGNVVFTVPDGWTKVQQGDTLLLIPNDVPGKFIFTLGIRKGQELNGQTLRQFLDAQLQTELSTGATVVNAAAVEESKLTSGVPVLNTTRVMATREKANFLAIYFALQAGTRGELVTVISNSQEVVQKYSDAIGRFIAALQFANLQPVTPVPSISVPSSSAPATPTTPKPGAAKGNSRIDGLYVHIAHSKDEKSFYGDGRLFYLDGRVYHGIPSGGLEAFDWKQACATQPNVCGQYTLTKTGTAGELHIQWGDNSEDDESLTFTDLGFTVGNDPWKRAERTTSTDIIGKWKAVNVSASPKPAGDVTLVGSDLEFLPDGTYKSSVPASNTQDATKSAKFNIQGYTIRFDRNESNLACTIFAYPGKPLVLNINGTDYIRQ